MLSLNFSQQEIDRIADVLDSESSSFVELFKIAGLDAATDCQGADLSNIDFGSDDLTGFNFSRSNLNGANLSKATGLTRDALTDALTDSATQLPETWGRAVNDIQSGLPAAVHDSEQPIEVSAVEAPNVEDTFESLTEEMAKLLRSREASAENISASNAADRVAIGEYEADGITYKMFADGSIEARHDNGVAHFDSKAELKSLLENEGAEGERQNESSRSVGRLVARKEIAKGSSGLLSAVRNRVNGIITRLLSWLKK